jgi:hypothetical protein
MKIPLSLPDGTELLYQEFTNNGSGDRIVAIDDRTYHVRSCQNQDGKQWFYTMLRVGRHQRTLRGDMPTILLAVARIHQVYDDYEKRCRRSKEDAQRLRDRQLNELFETAG